MNPLNKISFPTGIHTPSAPSFSEGNVPLFKKNVDKARQDLQKRLKSPFDLLVNPDPEQKDQPRPKKPPFFKKDASSKLKELMSHFQHLAARQILSEKKNRNWKNLYKGNAVLINYLYGKTCDIAEPSESPKDVKAKLRHKPIFK